MSTAAANIGLANHELICMAKAGVKGLTLSAAKTYARKNKGSILFRRGS